MSLFGTSFKTESIFQREVIDATSVGSVQVSSVADIQLAGSGSENIEAVLEGEVSERIADHLEFTVNQKGSLLEITVEFNKSLFIGMTFTDLKLSVSLPEKVYQNVTIKSSSADCIVNNVSAESFSGISSSGRQILSGLNISGRLVVKGSSGNIIVNNSHASLLIGNITSGKLSVKEVACPNVKIDATSGSISIHNEKLEAAMDCKVTSGNISISSGLFNGNLGIRATSGNVDIFSRTFADNLSINCHKTSGACSVHVDGLTVRENSRERYAAGRGEAGGSTIQASVTSGRMTVAEPGQGV